MLILCSFLEEGRIHLQRERILGIGPIFPDGPMAGWPLYAYLEKEIWEESFVVLPCLFEWSIGRSSCSYRFL